MMKRGIFCKTAVLCAVVGMGNAASGETETKYKSVTWETLNKAEIPLASIGRLATPHARDILSSPWSVGCETLGRDYADFSNYKEFVGELGVKHARIQSGWAKTEKKKGVYNFKWLDPIVYGLKEQGVEPWICLCYGNPLYKSDTGLGAGIFTDEATMEGWRQYVAATVSHYKDTVTEWEIWNEPKHSADPEAYANLLILTARTIKEIQPDATLMGFTVHGRFTGSALKFPRAVFDVLKDQDSLELIDYVTYHPYTPNPDAFYTTMDELQGMVKSYNPRMKLYQGESGCPATLLWAFAMRDLPWTEYSQAKWVARRMAGDGARGIRSSVFTIIDLNYGFFLNEKGLLRADLKKNVIYRRPSYYAVRNIATFFDSTVQPTGLLEYATDSDRKLEVAGFSKADSTVVLAWFNDKLPDNELSRDTIRLTIKNVSFKDPVYVDILTGKVYELDAADFKIGPNQTTFLKLPMWDAPVLLAERKQVPLTLTEGK